MPTHHVLAHHQIPGFEHGLPDDVVQLAHVPGPGVGHQQRQGAGHDLLDGSAQLNARLGKEAVGEVRDIDGPVAQRGDGDGVLGQAEVEVGPE
jgi:hypothetical protein